MQSIINYVSLFSGIGGFELGFEQASTVKGSGTQSETRFNCIGFSEVDPVAIAIYQRHFPSHRPVGDIDAVDIGSLPDFDLLVGGFPCQAFSMAGRRRGFSDPRGNLFFAIARVLEQKRPRFLLLENVKGLLSHQKGETFQTILTILDELGYDLQWQVLNSKGFGVPQSRQRVYLVGHLAKTCRPEIFPLTGEAGPSCQVIARAHGLKGHDCLKRIYSPRGASPTLVTNSGGNQFAKFEIDGQVRRLTPIECERLQGFPDGWTVGFSDARRFRCLGNAVTVPVVAAIAEHLVRSIEAQF